MYEHWLGTEHALTTLVEVQRAANQDFLAMVNAQANANIDASSGENIGDYLVSVEDGVGIVQVAGSLTNNYRWYHPFIDNQVTSYEAIADAITGLANDDSVREIVLSISSGGGMVMGLENLSSKIKAVDQIKPVRAHTSSAAFSAAYWIAASTREIVSTPMASTGSIGTLLVHQSIAQMAEKAGVTFTVFRAGKYKALGLPYEDLSDSDKEYMQDRLDKTNDFFLEHVAENRNLSLASRGVWAEGKTFFTSEAIAVGLVDRVAQLEDLVRASGAQQQPGRNRMFISEQKRAQIAAGAKPEDVLTAEELEQYTAETKTPEAPAEGAETDKGPEANEGDEGDKTPSTPVATDASAKAEYHQLLKQNGGLEAKLEAAEARLAEMQVKLEQQDSRVASLCEIGKLAVNNLQVALGLPKESFATAEGLVTAYNGLQEKMAAKFKTGQQSQETPTEAADDFNVPMAFRHMKKEG